MKSLVGQTAALVALLGGGDPHADGEIASAFGLGTGASPPPFTSSLDAALSLADRFLPGWRLESCGDLVFGPPQRRLFGGHFAVYEDGAFSTVRAEGPTRALAHCAAILEASDRMREEIADRLVEEVAENEVDGGERYFADLRAVGSCFLRPLEPPSIDADEDCLTLRWEDGGGRMFTLTFMGKGNVTGNLLDKECRTPAWKVGVGEAAYLISVLNGDRVSALMRGRRLPAR
jgi:hypothetical protein